jgi:hypothetical protein
MQKTFFKLVFSSHLEGNDEIEGSADPDPDPHQSVMDPQHWY